jgi:hypothetical protein
MVILTLPFVHVFRIQVMNYDPSSDTIEIVHYNEKKAHNDPMNVFKYRFLLFSSATNVSIQHTWSLRRKHKSTHYCYPL